jgi:hypothetical protein
MAITNYGTLKTAVANFAKPSTSLPAAETASRIPEYIANSRAELQRILIKAKFRKLDNLTTSLAVTSGVATIPSGFQAVKSLRQNASGYERITYQPIDRIESFNYAETGEPRHYDRVGDTLVFWPATTTTVRMRWTGSLTVLSADGDTDWLITSHPDLSLYGALLEADLRLDLEEMRGKWEAAYTRKLGDMLATDMALPDAIIPLPNGVAV